MNPYFAPSEAELLAHSSFLEELSCTLVADRQTADDIVQDTWLAVLEHPPAHSINPAGWLRTVANNLARRGYRTRARQSYREREVARNEGLPGVDDDYERTQTLGRVAGAVEQLPEPYRTVVFLRFFENKKPGEISAELDVPIATIKSQLHRGLDRLRTELEEEFGQDGADWRGILCGCFGWRMADGNPVPIGLSSSATSFGAKVGAAVLALLAITTLVLFTGGNQEPGGNSVAGATLAKENNDELAQVELDPREAITPLANVETAKPDPNKVLVTILAPDGQPVAGGKVMLVNDEDFVEIGETDNLGATPITIRSSWYMPPRVFSEMQAPIPPVEPRVGLMATADGYCSSLVSWIEPDKLEEQAVTLTLVPHGFSLTGRVVDEDGLPIEGVRVSRHDTREGVQRNQSSDLVVHPAPATETDALGRFAFSSLTTGLSWFRFDSPEHAVHWKRRVVREDSKVELEMTLERGGTVVGTVVGPNGLPVAAARIWSTTHDGVHEISTTSSPSGEFRLNGIPAGPRFLFARGGKHNGFGARTRLMVESDGEVSWYPELIALPSIKLRFVNQDDVPLKNTDIHMRVKSGSRMKRFDETTDEDGALVVHEQSNKVDRIDFYLSTRYGSVFNFPDAHLDKIQLGDTLHTVVVDEAILNKGRIDFELTTAEGDAFEEVAILARGKRDAVTRRIFVTHNDTSIRAPHVVPDDLQLIASCTGLGNIELGAVTLKPGETLEIPDVRAPKLGTVHIDWRYPEGGGEEIGIVQHLREVKMKAIGLRLARTEALTPLESYELLPGDYSLRVFRNRELVQFVRFTITAGFETSIEVHPEGESGE